MKVEYINPFILSSLNCFETMVGVKPDVGRPSIRTKTQQSGAFISGVIGLSGDVVGSVVLSFPKLVALKVVSAMMGMEIKIIDDTVTDAIGEITNIVAGRAKEGMKGQNVSISIPNVVVGNDHAVHRPSALPCVMIPFTTEWGDFSVDVSLKEASANGAAAPDDENEAQGGAA